MAIVEGNICARQQITIALYPTSGSIRSKTGYDASPTYTWRRAVINDASAWFLAERANGRAIGSRYCVASVCLSYVSVYGMYCVVASLNGAS